MRVCYFIQNHLGPGQVDRLIRAIRRDSPDALVLVGHDPHAGHCTTDGMRAALPDAEVFEVAGRPRRGFYSLLEPWFEAVEWLERHEREYDWLVYLSAQDYPTQPIRRFEQMLADTPFDGFLRYWDASIAESPWGRRKQGIYRYFFQYYDAPEPLHHLLPLARRLNRFVRFMHTHLVFGPRVGFRVRSSPFKEDFVCYAGKQWTTLRRACAIHALEESRRNEAVIRWFRRTVCPDEAVIQTLLVNAGRFNLQNDDLRYADFTGSRDGRPHTLTAADFPTITDGSSWFARKFDPAVDAKILEMLDEWNASPE